MTTPPAYHGHAHSPVCACSVPRGIPRRPEPTRLVLEPFQSSWRPLCRVVTSGQQASASSAARVSCRVGGAPAWPGCSPETLPVSAFPPSRAGAVTAAELEEPGGADICNFLQIRPPLVLQKASGGPWQKILVEQAPTAARTTSSPLEWKCPLAPRGPTAGRGGKTDPCPTGRRRMACSTENWHATPSESMVLLNSKGLKRYFCEPLTAWSLRLRSGARDGRGWLAVAGTLWAGTLSSISADPESWQRFHLRLDLWSGSNIIELLIGR
ncbi:hypothetical protein NDU88_000369 [Pleurodeles waltl]|uniref:Uncharacterized protein n=1 Tax=Pleurodeles waltl TaxID=8319 RepID=A0AAV7L6N4_PLEWA|nr:hypothetical protein NDU88_000369 [Pleurodeles waltl]